MSKLTTQSHPQQGVSIPGQIKHNHGGHLRIFLGAAPGVGKTCAMLHAAKEHMQQKRSVLVGQVETHGQDEPEQLLNGLERLPRRHIQFANQTLSEFDLDTALQRKPDLILVDELAHTNVPGSRHKHRYQDIAELLKAGIDVYTTLNIQHLASLSDLVTQITNVRVRETVPDQFIDSANEIIFVDLAPAMLIERLQQAKVAVPEYARSSPNNFFSLSVLSALRELALREVMKILDRQSNAPAATQAKALDFVIHEQLLVLISTNSDHEYLICNGRQIADRHRIPWLVVWVDTGQVPNQQRIKRLQAAFLLARELGARTEVLRGPGTYQAIVPFITQHRINRVLVGAGRRHHFKPWRQRLYQQLIESGLPIEVSVMRSPDIPVVPIVGIDSTTPMLGNRRGYGYGIIGVSIASVLAVLLENWFHNANFVLVYVLAVILTGLRYGSRPAVAASILSFLCFNFFLIEPRHTFEVAREDEVSTLVFLFLIALVSGPAASRVRRQFILLREANRYSEAMRSLGQALSVAENTEAVWLATAGKLASTLQVECCIARTGEAGSCSSFPNPTLAFCAVDIAAIEWTQRHNAPSGRLTDTLSTSIWTVFPIAKEEHCIACALIRFNPTGNHLQPYDRELVNGMLQQAANTWRRIQLVSELESARVSTEVEQLRSALLSSVSHDLKSPLAAMMGAADSLRCLDKQLDVQDREDLLDTILQESRRLDSYIQNLLDMTRLGYGTLKIERDWVAVTDIMGSALARLKRYHAKVKIELHFVGSMPVLYVHAALIEQALFNILENAAKFTQVDEPVIVSITRKANKCIIAIEDTGPGIPESVREKIFDMFYVVADGDKKLQSTGMGLAICKGMISAHGGAVYALEGSGNKGTRIVVELSCEYPDASTTTVEEERAT